MFFFSYIFVTVNQKTFYKFKTVTKMKKMIFTAMAVLAFSAVSMAKSPKVVKKTKKVNVKVAAPDCGLEKFKAYIFFREMGFSRDEASSASYSVYFDCMQIM